jgi:hypothetical protein
MKDIPEAPKIELVDNPHAPDVFADSATGWYILNGNIRITLEVARMGHTVDSPGPVRRIVIGRLVMPIEQVEAMAKGLLAFIDQQRSQAVPMGGGKPTLQ